MKVALANLKNSFKLASMQTLAAPLHNNENYKHCSWLNVFQCLMNQSMDPNQQCVRK